MMAAQTGRQGSIRRVRPTSEASHGGQPVSQLLFLACLEVLIVVVHTNTRAKLVVSPALTPNWKPPTSRLVVVLLLADM